MTRIYTYPLTNCDCGNASATASATASASASKGFTVFNPTSTSASPPKILNPQSFYPLSSDFYRFSDYYVSPPDSRLISSPLGGAVLKLNRPPRNSAIPLSKMYESGLASSPEIPTDYKSVPIGDITYYVDKDISNAIYSPVYNIPTIVNNVDYTDPMDNYKPQYNRQNSTYLTVSNAINNGFNNGFPPLLSCGNNNKDFSLPFSLSFLADTSEAREQLMARQQLKYNQQKWTALNKF